MTAILVHSRPLFCRVVALIDATADIRIVRLAVIRGGAFRFAAGQYARVTFAGHKPRDYSLASRPDDAQLEFHIRHRADGGAGHFVARTLRIGDGVWVEGPYGDAWLRRDRPGPIICVAGGSGLAPMKSIVETALAIRASQEITLYFGGRDENDIYFEEHFIELGRRHANFRYIAVVSEPQEPTGRRHATVVEALAADRAALGDGPGIAANATAYLAGPPAMVLAARATLLGLGLRAVDIHGDPFYPAQASTSAAKV